MKYLDIKLIEKKLKEDTDKYTVIVVYIDGDKYEITDILKKHMDAPRFAAAIKKMAKRKFPNKQFKTFYVVGADGGKIDGYDFNVLKTDELDPDGVPDKKDDKKDDKKGEIDPQDADSIELDTTPLPKPPKVQPETNNDAIKLPSADQVDPAAEKTDDEIAAMTKKQQKDQPTFTFLDNNATAAMDYNTKRSKTVDKDRDGKNDETGEVLPLIYDDGTLRDPNNPEKVIGTVPGYKKPIERDLEGGSTGSGEEGESGLSGEQAGSAPDIADEVYEALDGMGTDETRLINALKRIETRAHLSEILKQYLKKYKSKMDDDIINDFKFDLGGFNSDQRIVLDQINDVMKKIGYVIYGNRFLGSMGWHDIEKFKIKGTYVGHDPRPGHGWHMGVVLNIGSQEFGISPTKIGGYFGTKYGSSYQIGPIKKVTAGPNQLQLVMPLENKVRSRLKSAWLSQELDRYISDNVPNNGKIEPVKVGDPLTKTHLKQATVIGKANGLSDSEMADLFDSFTGGRDEMIGVPLPQYWVDMINNYKGNGK